MKRLNWEHWYSVDILRKHLGGSLEAASLQGLTRQRACCEAAAGVLVWLATAPAGNAQIFQYVSTLPTRLCLEGPVGATSA